MKTSIKTLVAPIALTFCFLFFIFYASAQNVGINETGTAPDNSALLDLSSTDKGFLITRVDTADIITPVAFGLMTLAPLDSCLYMYNGETSGKTWISIGGVGSNCPCSCSPTTPPSTVSCPPDNTTAVVEVTSGTGKIWMDRNLGASQVATSSTDAAAYGDLYQWGRCSDGHEKRTSGTTTTLSTTDSPGNGNFILASTSSSYDWRSPKNDNLWQGVAGINNPCPTGYRIPTEAELDAERQSWGSQDAAGAFSSPLKLPMGGSRDFVTGSFFQPGTIGYLRSSTVSGGFSQGLSFDSLGSGMGSYTRASGYSVRCIKD